MYLSTVVPALGDPRRERPPAVYGHVVNVPTHFNVKLPAIGGHLPNADADSHLLVVRTCYNGQCKQMPRFRSFKAKIARGMHPELRPTVLSNVHAASGDRKQYFISSVNACVMNNIAGDDECSRAKCTTFDAAHPSLRRAATCHVRTLLPSPEGVRS